MSQSEPCSAADAAATPGRGDWEALPRRARWLFRLNALAAAFAVPLPVIVVGGVARFRFDSLTQMLIAFLALVALPAALGWWLGGRLHRRVRYRFDAEGLRLRRGWCWRSETLVPRNRVQHLDLERGPLERRLGLTTLVLHTAGTRFNVVRVIGLEAARARQLRDALVDSDAGADDDAV